MNKFLTNTVAALFAVFTAISAYAVDQSADDKLLFAVGDMTGGTSTYVSMWKDLARVGCVTNINPKSTTGSVENAALLFNNDVDGGWLQGDYAAYAVKQDPQLGNKIAGLLAMHQEFVHFIAAPAVSGKWFKITVKLVEIGQLNGKGVGAVGGSTMTAEFIKIIGGYNYTVTSYPSNDKLKAALLNGDIAAAVFVTGQSSPLIKDLDGEKFSLLYASGDLITKITSNPQYSKVYQPAVVTYLNLGVVGLSVLSTRSLLAVRVTDVTDMKNGFNGLRECVAKNLPDLKGRRGMNTNWNTVDPAAATSIARFK